MAERNERMRVKRGLRSPRSGATNRRWVLGAVLPFAILSQIVLAMDGEDDSLHSQQDSQDLLQATIAGAMPSHFASPIGRLNSTI